MRVWSVEWGRWRFDDGKTGREEAPGELPETPENIEDNHDVQMARRIMKR
jgi:hypothetical protein